MKDLLDKISSYNLFNYLFPGVVFVIILSKISSYNFIQKDIVVGVFFYYFIGLLISRIGSILIEPLLKTLKFLKFSEYKDFIFASQKDEKIELFSEVNNMYRTLSSMFIVLVSVKLFDLAAKKFSSLNNIDSIYILLLIVVLCLFSYRKQTKYITMRIEVKKEDK